MECEKCIYGRHYGAGDLGCTYFREFRSLKRYVKRPDWCCLNGVRICLEHKIIHMRLCSSKYGNPEGEYYLCNDSVKANQDKLTSVWDKVNCKNCLKKLNSSNTDSKNKEEDTETFCNNQGNKVI